MPAILGVLLLIGAIYVVQKEFRHLRLRDIEDALRDIPLRALAIGFLWTVLSYAVLTIYDRLGTIYAGHKVSYGRVAFASFCAYALSHNLGFAAVSGAAVRYRLYAHWGLTPLQIAKTVAFCSLTFALGGMVLGGTILFLEPQSIPFFGEHLPACGDVRGGRAAVGDRDRLRHAVARPRQRAAVRLRDRPAGLAHGDPAGGAGDGRCRDHRVDLLRAAAGRAAADLADLPRRLCRVLHRRARRQPARRHRRVRHRDPARPGSLTSARRTSSARSWCSGCITTSSRCSSPASCSPATRSCCAAACCCAGPSGSGALARWSEPDFAVASATGLVALCGVMLLCVGVLAPQPDFSWIDPDFAEMANQAGQFIPSLIGAGLIVVALGLSQRVNLAWGATIFLLVVGAAFTATQSERLWISGVLVVVVMLVAPFRRCFYRHASLLSGPLEASSAISLFALVICLLALAGTRPRVHLLTNNAWWAVVMSHEVPNSLRLTVALAVVLALIAIWRLLRPGKVRWLPWDAASRQRLALLGGTIPPAKADGVVLGEAERAGIPFRRCGRVLLGLGDPMGAEADRVSAIWRLRDLAQQEGLDPAFWRAGPGLLKVYGDLGLTALPLGSDGLPLPKATDGTPEARQYLVCVAERDLNDAAAAAAAVGDQPGHRAGGGVRPDSAATGGIIATGA